jgi:hypothetical protein
VSSPNWAARGRKRRQFARCAVDVSVFASQPADRQKNHCSPPGR